MPESLLSAALEYAQKGFAVFPIHSVRDGACSCGKSECGRNTAKHPRTPQGFKDATRDPERIRAWWTEWPDANIGIATGAPSGVIVVDVDEGLKPDGTKKNGEEVLRALEASHGKLPAAPVVRTGSGGRHLYFSHPGGTVPGKNAAFPCIDIKSDGGYVLAPPSVNASGAYAWTDVVPMPAMPAWVLSATSAPKKSTAADLDGAYEPKPLTPAIEKAAREKLKSFGPAVSGEAGNDKTYRACALIARGFQLAPEDALPLLLEWNKTCQPPWSDDELGELLGHALRYGKGGVGTDRFMAEMMFKQASTPALPPEPTAPAGTWEGELQRAKLDLATRLPSANASVSVRRSFASSAAGLRTKKWPATPWLVRGLLTEKSLTVIAGEPKTTKTWSALELALAVASGTKAFGEFPATTTGPVALFMAEDSERSLWNRLRSLNQGRPAEVLDSVHYECRSALALEDDDGLAGIIASCRLMPKPPVLLVLDPLRDLHGADENDSGAMAAIMARLRALRDILGCAVCFVHHSAKSSRDVGARRAGQRMRGSSVVHGAVDGGIYLYDLDTDAHHRWENSIEVEVKAAEGAGKFRVALEVDDDSSGQAIKAKWSYSKEKVERIDLDADEKMMGLVASYLKAKALKNPAEMFQADVLAKKMGKRRIDIDLALKDILALPASHPLAGRIRQMPRPGRGGGYIWQYVLSSEDLEDEARAKLALKKA